MSKRSNIMFLIFTITIIISFTLQIILNSVINAAQTVSLSVTPKPEIDVVLAKSKTATDLTNFKTRLEQELTKLGVDITKVKISDIQAQNVDISKSFAWEQNIDSRIGSITISQDGKDVTMKGNGSEPGKNAIWIMPENAQEQEFSFGYNIDYGDSFNAAGMLLRVQRKDNTLEGYMLSFNNSSGDNWQSAAQGNLGAIWKFTYIIGQNYHINMTKTLLKPLGIQKSGTINVKVTETDITVTGGGIRSNNIYISRTIWFFWKWIWIFYRSL